MLQGIISAVGTLLMIIIILVLAYLCTRYLGKGVRPLGAGTASRYLKVIDRVYLGQESSVALVQMSDRIFFLGITGEQVSLLTEVREEELSEFSFPDVQNGNLGTAAFKDVMDRMKNRKK